MYLLIYKIHWRVIMLIYTFFSFSTGCSPPYQFDTCNDGHFEVGSDYGMLELSSFSFFSIIQEGYSKLWSLLGYSPAINSYKLLTFYEEAPKPGIWKVHFVVTRNIQSHIQVA